MITDLLAAERDFEIVGTAEGADNALVTAREQGANLIITQDQSEVRDQCLDAIVQDVPLTILALAPGGSAGTSINLSRRTMRLQGGDRSALADVIRKAMEPA